SAAPAGPSSGSTGRRSTTRPTTARTWSGGKSKVGGRWQRPLHVRRRSDDRLAETRWLDRSGNSPGCWSTVSKIESEPDRPLVTERDDHPSTRGGSRGAPAGRGRAFAP